VPANAGDGLVCNGLAEGSVAWVWEFESTGVVTLLEGGMPLLNAVGA
jgi:hypothetical protein